MTLEFIDENDIPTNGKGGGQAGATTKFVEELKLHPGRWAIYPVLGKHPGAHGNRMKRLRELGCESTQRTVDGTTTLYVRWPEQNGHA